MPFFHFRKGCAQSLTAFFSFTTKTGNAERGKQYFNVRLLQLRPVEDPKPPVQNFMATIESLAVVLRRHGQSQNEGQQSVRRDWQVTGLYARQRKCPLEHSRLGQSHPASNGHPFGRQDCIFDSQRGLYAFYLSFSVALSLRNMFVPGSIGCSSANQCLSDC